MAAIQDQGVAIPSAVLEKAAAALDQELASVQGMETVAFHAQQEITY